VAARSESSPYLLDFQFPPSVQVRIHPSVARVDTYLGWGEGGRSGGDERVKKSDKKSAYSYRGNGLIFRHDMSVNRMGGCSYNLTKL
jgi:hypothetical protein